MKGSIHSDQTCPVCGSRFKSQEPRGLFCPNHPEQAPQKFVVRYEKITKRFNNYPAALQFLTGLRFQEGSGQFDARDYQVKSKPLAFDKLADEWLLLKGSQLKKSSITSFRSGIERAQAKWQGANIKSIKYAEIEDFLNSYPGASKTRLNVSMALKQFFAWATDRYDIPALKKWPPIGHVQMAFRDTVDLHTQESILENIKDHEPFRVWLCIKWLATYIAIRPGEMRSLTEGQVDRQRGLLIIPHPKEKESKIVPLLDEDLAIVRALPHAFDSSMPFFRHMKAIKGGTKMGDTFGHNVIYRSWKRACGRLGISGVSLYPGTKHSTAMGIRQQATFEEVRLATGHRTNKAFERYVRTEGNAMREILKKRKSVIISDNGLITDSQRVKDGQVFNFKT